MSEYHRLPLSLAHLRLSESTDLIDRRHGRASTAVTANISLSEWGRYLGAATLKAAIPNRLAMHAIRIDIDGPSYRQHVAKRRADRSGTKDVSASE